MSTYDYPYTQLDATLEVLFRHGNVKLGGVEKLAQFFVKLLLTQKGSSLDDETYGTGLVDIIGSTTDKEGHSARLRIAEAVRSAARWMKEMQLKNPVEDHEMLREVKVINVTYDAQTGRAEIKLLLINNKGRSVVFGFSV